MWNLTGRSRHSSVRSWVRTDRPAMQIYLATAFRITTHLSFATTATPNQSMKPTAPLRKHSQCVCHDTLPWLISFSLDGHQGAGIVAFHRWCCLGACYRV